NDRSGAASRLDLDLTGAIGKCESAWERESAWRGFTRRKFRIRRGLLQFMPAFCDNQRVHRVLARFTMDLQLKPIGEQRLKHLGHFVSCRAIGHFREDVEP